MLGPAVPMTVKWQGLVAADSNMSPAAMGFLRAKLMHV